MTGPPFREATSVAEACRLLAADTEGTRLISGGTAVTLLLRLGLLDAERLVSVRRLPDLHGITRTGGGLRIGAATTLREVATSPAVRASAPSLADACGQVGNPRVRNVATIGGNLAEADYASDPPAVLISLGASCDVAGPSGTRRLAVADLITDFYETTLAPDELVTAVEIPPGPPSRRAVYLKYRSRSSEDRACVGVAARVDFRADAGNTVEDVDVVVGAVAAIPQRVPAALRAVVGSRLDPDVARRVAGAYAEAIDPMEDGRGSRWYRTRMIRVWVERALLSLRDGSPTAGWQA